MIKRGECFVIPRNASLKDLVKWPSGGACTVHRSGRFDSSAKTLRPDHLVKCRLCGQPVGRDNGTARQAVFCGIYCSTVNQMKDLLATE